MLKILFGILLFINGILLAWQQGWLGALSLANQDPTRMSAQLHPERLKLIALDTQQETTTAQQSTPQQTDLTAATNHDAHPLPAAAATLTPASTSLANTASKTIPAPLEKTTSVSPKPAEPAPKVFACLDLGNFAAEDARRFETQLSALGLNGRITRQQTLENTRYIVYVPPQKNREAAERTGAQLRALGVTDYFIIQDTSPLQWGISLGIFSTEEAANNYLKTMTARGVDPVRVGMRSQSGNRIFFRLRRIDVKARQEIDHIRKKFPRTQWRQCT